MSEGTIAQWFVAEGDTVSAGQELVEVEAAKVTNTVTAPAAGVIGALLVPEGDTVPVNTVLVEILSEESSSAGVPGPENADVPLPTGEVAEVRPTELAPESDLTAADTVAASSEDTVPRDAAAARANSGRVTHVVPLARKLAKEKGIDLRTVTGTGTNGRIVVADVEAVASGGSGSASAAPASTPAPAVERASGDGSKLSSMRRIIGERMTASLQESAQLTLMTTVDVTDFAQLRETIGGGARKPGYVDAVIRACALALRDHPGVNARLEGDQIVQDEAVNIGMAVALDEGLVVPVIRDADRLRLADLGARVRELAERARSGQLSPDDYDGGTFSVTSLGGQGIDAFTPILNPPESAILGIGRSREVPIRFGDGIAWRQEMTLSLTIDHRVIDGYPGALFLQDVVARLERPRELL